MATVFAPENWYAVGGSAGLSPGSVMPATILGQELVVWRDDKGAVHAWNNRCTHRGMRLSYGFVDGDRLACRYHGWRYGAGGRCIYIPAHPDLEPPDTFCVPPFASAEHLGLVWANTSAAGEAAPDLPDLDVSDGTMRFCRSVAIRAAPERVVEIACRALFPPYGVRATDSDSRLVPIARAESGEGGRYHCRWSGGGKTIDVGYAANVVSPGVVAIHADFEAGRETMITAIQPVGVDHTQVHVLVATAVPDSDVAALRRHYAGWCRRWRWDVENADAETTSWRTVAE